MQILVTDVTEMGGGNHCVAGWDGQGQRMIRPLPNGGNWSAGLIGLHGIRPGITINVAPSGVANGQYPHRTEDTPINPALIQVVNAGPPNWLGHGSPSRAGTVPEAFNGNVVGNGQWNGRVTGAHVPVDTHSRSLWGLEIDRVSLSFVEDFGKLKAVVNDGENAYIISVSAQNLKAAYRAGGAGAANSALPNGGRLHVRLGLARAWSGQPDKCYVMVNGVYW
ncbi:MAG: hypothetical protein EOP60_02955 [Sphingomonadales bacterium]|nr:MAG: hypothetical protein EOP60_02955 [Sphingomonadales bacterium]